MAIIVEPEIGGLAYVICRPFFQGDVPHIRHALGVIKEEKTANIISEKKFKIKNIDEWIPFYRMRQFTFGGVMLNNYSFDEERCIREDKKHIEIIEKMKRVK